MSGSTIADLESAVKVEQEALERAYTARNPVSIALYQGTLRRASEALTAALVKDTTCDCGVCP